LQVEFLKKVEREVAKRVELISSAQIQDGINIVNLGDGEFNRWNLHQYHTKKPSEPTKDSEWTGENEMINDNLIDGVTTTSGKEVTGVKTKNNETEAVQEGSHHNIKGRAIVGGMLVAM
ncbi:13812_t:CDS:2, partial [Acaulospora morrowiae]